jgi:CO/xanthine dehydrogenase Mo-binding subunit
VFDPIEAMESRSVLVHEDMMEYSHTATTFPQPGTNICHQFRLRVGNAEKGFSISDEIFENIFVTQAQTNCPMEPRASIAMVDQSGRITVWSSTQAVYTVLTGLSDLFKVPQNRIRVVAPPLGGGFGTKVYLKAEPIAVVLAQRTNGRPVKYQYTRDEEFTVPTMRHPSNIRIKTGVKKDGTLLAQKVSIVWDTGAYADNGTLVCRNGSFSAPGPYRTPHVEVDGYCVYTNKIVGGAIRGFGLPQPMFALESQLDIVAEKLGIDPVDLRLRNAVENGSINASNQKIPHTALKECIQEAAHVSNWKDRRSGPTVKEGVKARGKGIAVMHKGTLTPTCSSSFARLEADGTLTILSSTASLGQGNETALAQIGAEILGIPFDWVSVYGPDTSATPFDRSTTSSRSTFHMGNAVCSAVLEVKKQLLEMAAKVFEINPDDLSIESGIVFPKDQRKYGLPLKEILARYFGGFGTILGKGVFYTSGGQLDPNTATGDTFSAFWMFGCAVADVEVDLETGKVKVEKIVLASDVGKAINPAMCTQQSEGGILMGIGYATLEELVFDNGKIQNANFVDYKIPTLTEVPEMVSLLIEKPNPDGPFGAKGMSEESLVAIAPAIANAVYNATGVRVKSLPITPEKILKGLKDKAMKGASHDVEL